MDGKSRASNCRPLEYFGTAPLRAHVSRRCRSATLRSVWVPCKHTTRSRKRSKASGGSTRTICNQSNLKQPQQGKLQQSRQRAHGGCAHGCTHPSQGSSALQHMLHHIQRCPLHHTQRCMERCIMAEMEEGKLLCGQRSRHGARRAGTSSAPWWSRADAP